MESVLKKLYLGQLIPEDSFYNLTKDIKERQAFDAVYGPFEEKLKSLGLLREYEAITDAYDNLQIELESAIFTGGFQLGAQLILAVLDPHMVF